MSSENVYLTDQIYTDTINIHSHELNRSNLNNIVLITNNRQYISARYIY